MLNISVFIAGIFIGKYLKKERIEKLIAEVKEFMGK